MILLAILGAPQKLIIGLILACPALIVMGFFLMAKGLHAFWEGRLPFSSTFDLTGVFARLGGLFFALCGVGLSVSMFVLEAALLWRLWVVWRGA